MKKNVKKNDFADVWSVIRHPSSEWVTKHLVQQFARSLKVDQVFSRSRRRIGKNRAAWQ